MVRECQRNMTLLPAQLLRVERNKISDPERALWTVVKWLHLVGMFRPPRPPEWRQQPRSRRGDPSLRRGPADRLLHPSRTRRLMPESWRCLAHPRSWSKSHVLFIWNRKTLALFALWHCQSQACIMEEGGDDDVCYYSVTAATGIDSLYDDRVDGWGQWHNEGAEVKRKKNGGSKWSYWYVFVHI